MTPKTNYLAKTTSVDSRSRDRLKLPGRDLKRNDQKSIWSSGNRKLDRIFFTTNLLKNCVVINFSI